MIDYVNQTLINAWQMCGERVRRRWIEGDIIPPGIAARIGTGLHAGAEINHRAKLNTGVDEPLDVVQDAARDGYVKSLDNGVYFPPDELFSAKRQLTEGVDTVTGLAAHPITSPAPDSAMICKNSRRLISYPGMSSPLRYSIKTSCTSRLLSLYQIKAETRKTIMQ